MDRAYWDKISENYNAEIFDVNKSDTKGIVKSWIKEIASSKKIIGDAGCGIGKWLTLLSPQFKQVVAMDLSVENLKYSASKYKNLKNITYLNNDYSRTLPSEHKFDAILCVNAILTPDAVKQNNFFKNLSANVKPNGDLILVVPSFESSLYSAQILDKCNSKGVVKNKKVSGTVSKDEFSKFKQGVVAIDTWHTKHFLREELISTLRDHGFKVVKMEKLEYPWHTEIKHPPKSLKGPYPWDWALMAKRVNTK